MADVKLTIDGRQVTAAPGTLVIDAAKTVGIEIPSFCYYEGLTLQAACRMCLVEVEKMPKLMTACTLPVAEGLVVRTDTPQVHAARKYMLDFLLSNHPLDCPVCDKGGECELQDMAFRYGVGESRFTEEKVHTPEKQFSPVVFYDAPRCILCYRCVRICDEGMGVAALGVINRGVVSEIAPNHGDHLECDECGECIDICPVGALTSGTYRYQTRPWEMTHVGTICAHCGDGCKTTLGTRNDRIIRGNNRDSSGVNGEFLCIKGRYAFDFYDHPGRLQAPLVRRNGRLEEVSWSEALKTVALKFNEVLAAGGSFGVIGSNHTTNEENFYLQKFARQVLKTNNIDHHRTGDVPALLSVIAGSGVVGQAIPPAGRAASLATVADLYTAKTALILGADLALEHPLLSYQLRANYRHHQARLYVVTPGPVREDKYAAASIRCGADPQVCGPTPTSAPGRKPVEGGTDYFAALEQLRDRLKSVPDLVILFNDAFQGEDIHRLVSFGDSLGIPVKYVCLVDYSNSRGAVDMGLTPELLPGHQPSGQPGLFLDQMLDSELDALWVVGANPYEPRGAGCQPAQVPSQSGIPETHRKAAFLVVQDLFLTETAALADVVFPAACAYEKNGTVTNVTGETQQLKRAVNTMGTKPDLEIMGLIAREMGVAATLGPWTPDAVLQEIRAAAAQWGGPPGLPWGSAQEPARAHSDHNGLFASGTLGRYSKILHSVLEGRTSR